MAISVASTVVLTRVLADNRDLQTPSGDIAIGWLIVEDLFTILVLALFGATGDSGGGVWMTLCWALLKLTVLIAFALIAGQKIIPWFLGYVARTVARDLFTLAVLVLALGIVIIGKPLAAFMVVMLLGRPLRSALSISVALAQIGEFSFILAALASSLNILRLKPSRPWWSLPWPHHSQSPALQMRRASRSLAGKQRHFKRDEANSDLGSAGN